MHEQDMRALFPPHIVAYLIEHAGVSTRLSLEQAPGFYWLPPGDALPVVVGMRLSLSFPLLISAVPLYTVRRSAFRRRQGNEPLVLNPDEDLQANWFSDGGICSNFPIHFFDAWLPTRPTFGINLVSRDEPMFVDPERTRVSTEFQSVSDLSVDPNRPGEQAEVLGVGTTESVNGTDTHPEQDGKESVKHVYLPRANAPLTPDWQRVDSIAGFVSAMFGAAQNYRDTTQSLLPSYRDRIVNVYFDPEEGGLNLAMDAETITKIQGKGQEAAQTILNDFNLRHHQWVRTVVLINLVERQLYELSQDISAINLEQLFEEQAAAEAAGEQAFPYGRSGGWRKKALPRIDALVALIAAETEQTLTEQRPPKPEAVLRVTPKF